LVLGPYTRAIQSALFHNLPSHMVPACGMSIIACGETLHRWHNEGMKHYYSIDRTNYDGSIVTSAISACHSLYSTVHSPDSQQAFALKCQLHTIGYLPDGSSYATEGRVKSGDPTTTCSNTIVSFLSSDPYFLKHCGPGNYRLIGTGDDLLVATTVPIDVPDYIQTQKEDYGLIVKCSYSDHPVKTSFLSSHPLPATYEGREVWAMTPLLGRCIPKLYFWQEPTVGVDYRAWVAGVTLAMRATAGHNPFINGILQQVDRVLPRVTPFFDKFQLDKIKYKLSGCPGIKTHASAWEWLAIRYGWRVPLISLAINSELTKMTQVPFLVGYTDFSSVFSIDS